jgi:hypothetical protein
MDHARNYFLPERFAKSAAEYEPFAGWQQGKKGPLSDDRNTRGELGSPSVTPSFAYT